MASQPNQPVGQAIQDTINIINTAAAGGTTVPEGVGSTKPKADGEGAFSSPATEKSAAENKNVPKTYCN